MSGALPFLALLSSLFSAGGALPLLLAGTLLMPLAWLFLARRPDPATLGTLPSANDRLWLRTVLGAALGEVFAYGAAALLVAFSSGDAVPLLVPFLLPAPWLLGLLLGAFCGAVSSRRHWRTEGVLAYLGLGFLAFGFLEYSVHLLETTPVGPAWALAGFLLATELFGFIVVFIYQFYSLEFLAGIPRRPVADAGGPGEALRPPVAIQVACFNEPYSVVRECLTSIRALKYPTDRLWVQLLDDSTDPGAGAQLAELCRTLGFQYRHRAERRGFKAGALNEGLAALPTEVGLIAIVDADYQVDPQFLLQTVPYFRDPSVAWVQTAQNYRNSGESGFTRFYALADAYFYRVIQPVRHEAGSSIFCGTMGVLRRSALEGVGGWDGGCITEDAEVSLRLYASGWRSVYLPKTLGSGLAPDRFPDWRSQFSRWAFGGLQMLRRDLPALRSRRLTYRQRFDFLASGLLWMDGAFLLAMAGGVVTLALGALTGLAWAAPSVPLLIGISLAPILLVLDGLIKTRLALGRVARVGWRDAIGVMGFWYAMKMTNLRASLRALLGYSMTFSRTPKSHDVTETGSWSRGVRPAVLELGLAAGIALVALVSAAESPLGSVWKGLGTIALVGWLGYYAASFSAAPLFSLLTRPGRRRRGRWSSPPGPVRP